MTNIRIDKIQIKRGTVANLPTLDDGELFYAYDTKEHYLGMGGVNQLISKDFSSLNQHYESVLSRFGVNGSGNLTIDDVEFTGGGSGALVFNTLTDLQAAYPNGTTQPAWVVADNSWYYWSGTVSPPSDTTAPILTITAGGTFTGTKTVTLSANETATIYYTLDNSDPKTSGTKLTYSTPLSLSVTTTLKAYAKDTAGNESAVQTVVYTLDATPPTDTTPPANITDIVFSNITSNGVTLTWAAVSDAASYDIYNGATLAGNVTGTTYNATSLTASTLYTFTVKPKDAANNVASGYSEQVTTAAPADTTAPVLTITPAATFTDTQTVVMSVNETATIYYTLDDTDPKTSGTKLTYTAPLTLTATDTVKAYARDTAGNESAVQTVTYTKQAAINILASDSFDRADDATTLGNATTGQAWVPLTGTFGISGNKAYVPSATNDAKAYIETSATDVSISADVSGTGTGEVGIYFRVVDANNWFRLITTVGVSGQSYLQKKIAGTSTTIQSFSIGTAIPGTLKVTTKSDGSIEVFLNGVSKLVKSDTSLNTATKHGIGLGGGNAAFKFDNFKIESL